MKLTEDKLRRIIREELNEIHPGTFQQIRKQLKMKHGLRITDWGKEDMNLQFIEFGTGQRAYIREMSHGYIQVSVGDKEETVSKDDAADKIAEFLKLTEVRKAVRQILHEAAGGMPQAEEEIRQYLQRNGTKAGADTYEYEDLHFHIDRMGGFATFVNVFRGRNDSESVANAKIEDGKVRLRTGQGPADKVDYRGPEPLIRALVARATGGQTVYR